MKDTYYISDVESQAERLLRMQRTVDTALALIDQLADTTAKALLSLVDKAKREMYQIGNQQMNILEDGIEEQRLRLSKLYYDPAEDVDLLQATKNDQGFYGCQPGKNQAQSFRQHIRQLHQFAHRGFFPDHAPWASFGGPPRGMKYLFLSSAGTPSKAGSLTGTWVLTGGGTYQVIAWGSIGRPYARPAYLFF